MLMEYVRAGFRICLLLPVACCLLSPRPALAAPGFSNVNPNGDTARIAAFLVQFKSASTSLTTDTGYFNNDTTTAGDLARVLLNRADTYYRKVSYGKLKLSYTVFDTLMVTLSDSKAGYTLRTDTNGLILMVREVMARVDTFVNFANYDNVTLFHAGPGKSITSVSGDMQTKVQNISSWPFTDTQSNDTVGYAVITPLENYKLSSTLTISFFGTFCHEFGHELGLPDLYDALTTTGGDGDWTLLANGNFQGGAAPLLGDSPTWMDPWSREYLGWGDTVAIDTTTYLTMNPVEIDSKIYKIAAKKGDTAEYFLLEYRQPGAGDPDTAPGVGLLIWHVDNNMGDVASNNVNVLGVVAHRRLDLEEADSADIGSSSGTYVGTSSHPWPGKKGKTAFADNTMPSSRPNSGAAARFSIKHIQARSSKITLLADFADTKAPADSFVTGVDQWSMYSLPFPLHKISYTANDLVTSLSSFGVTFSAAELWRWNPQITDTEQDAINQKYKALSQTTALTAGFGYWIRLQDSTSKDIEETTQTPTFTDTVIHDTVPVALFAGWNQIGTPFDFRVLLRDLIFVSTGGSTYAYSAAVTAGLLRDGEIYYYKHGTGYLHGPSLSGTTVTNPTLDPFKGYWIYAGQTCTMLVPPYPSRLPPSAGFSAPAYRAPAIGSAALYDDWELQFEITNRRGDVERQTFAGVKPAASSVFKAPTSPSGIWVGLQEGTENYSAVYRSPAADRTWKLKIGTDAPGEVTVRVLQIESVPGSIPLTLQDLASGATVDLRRSAFYAYTPAPGEFRSFLLTAGGGEGSSVAYPRACLIERLERLVPGIELLNYSGLRTFRDRLLSSRIGRQMIGGYYRLSK